MGASLVEIAPTLEMFGRWFQGAKFIEINVLNGWEWNFR